jgi:chaperonin GroEL
MKDLSTSVGATLLTRENGLQIRDIQLTHFGQSKKISINKGWTTIIGGKGDQNEIDKQIEKIKAEIKNTESLKECERLQERVTRLASGVSVIRVGAATEVEMIEKKHRIDDALEAVRSAQMEGLIAGGGSTLIHAVKDLEIKTDNEEQLIGAKIIFEAVESPLRQMATNAGLSPDLIVNSVHSCDQGYGYNFMTNEITELSKHGVVDPVKVTRCALETAVSVASTLLTSGHAIVSQ